MHREVRPHSGEQELGARTSGVGGKEENRSRDLVFFFGG